MSRFTFTRDFYIPKGSTKIADRKSDAVVYVYETAGKLAAKGFHGKAAKPDWHFTFRDAASREQRIKEHFAHWQRVAERKAESRAERSKPHSFEVGHVLYASWGYEQTNIDFYQVTRIIGPHMIELRAVRQVSASNGNEPRDTGKCVPSLDDFTGEPMRRRADGRFKSVKIDEVRRATLWDGRPVNWTAYY